MRGLVASAFRFSWALSLYGAQQMVNLVTPSRAAGAFQSASRALEAELGGTLRQVFRAGDELQANILDGGLAGAGNRSPAGATRARAAPSPTPRARRAEGWGPIPYTVTPPPKEPASSARVEAISAEYPFEPHYVDVHGSRMHYIEAGIGDPILLLHGNPTWSYVWRNVIPHLAPLGRCIAPDLIGFGRSDKPKLEYRWGDHVRYLEAFIGRMDLRNVVLVLHDQGSGLGLHYARRHEENVRGLALFEAILRPYSWDRFSTPEFRELFRKFRSGGVGGEGWDLIVERNVFIEQLLPQAAGRPLTPREMEYYREPFRDRESRIPVWRFPKETPIGGEPPDVWRAVAEYSEWLKHTPLPKLLLYAEPGALVTAEHLEWARDQIQGLETVPLGFGLHFVQESSPHEIGREVARWIAALPPARHRWNRDS